MGLADLVAQGGSYKKQAKKKKPAVTPTSAKAALAGSTPSASSGGGKVRSSSRKRSGRGATPVTDRYVKGTRTKSAPKSSVAKTYAADTARVKAARKAPDPVDVALARADVALKKATALAPKPYKAETARARKTAPKRTIVPGAKKVVREAAGPKPRAVKRVKRRLKKAAKRATRTNLDRPFGPNETITPKDAARLAEAQGLPGKTYAQIAQGESGLRPAATGHDPGGTVGKGLWQMTPGVQSAQTQSAWNKIASKHKGGYNNPVANAEMAKYLAGSGTGVSNYYGTGFVTSPNAHLKGGPAKAQKKLSSKPIPKPLKRRAKEVLGKGKTKEIIQSAAPSTDPLTTKKLRQDVLSAIPKEYRSEGRGDKRTPAENAAVGGSATSDHLTGQTSFAADLPADNNLAIKIAKNLGMEGHTGIQEVVKDGVRYQMIWQAAGHYDHVHLGARPADGAVGTSSSGASGYSGLGGSASSSANPTPSSDRSKRQRRESVSRRLRAIDARMTTTLRSLPEPEKAQVRQITANLEPEDVQRMIAALT